MAEGLISTEVILAPNLEASIDRNPDPHPISIARNLVARGFMNFSNASAISSESSRGEYTEEGSSILRFL